MAACALILLASAWCVDVAPAMEVTDMPSTVVRARTPTVPVLVSAFMIVPIRLFRLVSLQVSSASLKSS